jgi:hypothetical protein
LSSPDKAASVLPNHFGTLSPSRVSAAVHARAVPRMSSARPAQQEPPPLVICAAQITRPSSAPAGPARLFHRADPTPAQVLCPSSAADNPLRATPTQQVKHPAGQPQAVSRDCSANGKTGSDTSSELESPSAGSEGAHGQRTYAGIAKRKAAAVRPAAAELHTAHAANWRAYYQQKSGNAPSAPLGTMSGN